MSSTNWARNKSQDYMFGSAYFVPPSYYYIALSQTNVSVSGSNITEPVGAGYARVPLYNSKSFFTYSTSGCLVNSGSIVFPETSGSWGTIVDVVLMDSLTSGSAWFFATLPVPKIVQTDTIISFSASAIDFSQS